MRLRVAQNAMVGHFGVRDIPAGSLWHVTAGAIGLLGMVLESENATMAPETFCAIESHAVFRCDRTVWIVATSASHGVTGFSLTRALRQSFELAGGTQARWRVPGKKEIACKFRKVGARLVIVDVLA